MPENVVTKEDREAVSVVYAASEVLQLVLTVLQLEHFRGVQYDQCEDLYTRAGRELTTIRGRISKLMPERRICQNNVSKS